MENLWERIYYDSPTNYIINEPIIAYDIQKANISILRSVGYLTEEQYLYYYHMDKNARQVAIGKMILRDRQITSIIKQGIVEAKRELFRILGLNDNQILRIKNDAVFFIKSGIIDLPDQIQVNEYVRFIKAGEYCSFYKLGKYMEIYYGYDIITGAETVSIRGIGQYSIQIHYDNIIARFIDVFHIAALRGPNEGLKASYALYTDYANKILPVDSYRRLDSSARFDLRVYRDCDYSQFANTSLMKYQADILPERNMMDYIDITFNEEFIHEISRFYLDARFRELG